MNLISIIGAGPGAPDLITKRAEERLKEAQVLVWTDSLVSPEIADLAPKSCERIPTSTLTLEKILQILIDRSSKGKRVVRLHDGDPCLYGALSEQISRLSDHEIEVEVVPGVSAYQATAAALKADHIRFIGREKVRIYCGRGNFEGFDSSVGETNCLGDNLENQVIELQVDRSTTTTVSHPSQRKLLCRTF